MKMKRFWLLLLCVLAVTALMQCAKEPTPESPTTQTGEDKATGEESKKDAGIASRTWRRHNRRQSRKPNAHKRQHQIGRAHV